MRFKNYILSFVLVFTYLLVNAQELFSPAGTSVSNSTVVFEYAIGDIIVGSNNNSNFQITQGFSQPRMVIKTYVPDDNFEAYLETHDASGNVVSVGDANSMGDGISNNDYVITANISGVTSLDVNNQNISDLTGIEDFSSISKLNCNSNNFGALYLTNLSTLDTLYCDSNQLSNLFLPSSNSVKYLSCNSNDFTSLDLSSYTALTDLYCKGRHPNTGQGGQITSLNLSQHNALKNLDCSNNQISNLSFANNNSLETIICYTNQITSIDLTQSPSLRILHCADNQISSLDVTQNTMLTELTVGENNDGSNGKGFAIGISEVVGNGYGGNLLTTLDVTQNPNLEILQFDNNVISYVNLVSNPNLKMLSSYGLTSINTVYNSSLKGLWITGTSINKLTNLDVTQNSNLKLIASSNNDFSSLINGVNLNYNLNLEVISFHSSELNTLDVSNNTALTQLYCSYNNFSSLDISQN